MTVPHETLSQYHNAQGEHTQPQVMVTAQYALLVTIARKLTQRR